jgi:signal transduction histidine kinase
MAVGLDEERIRDVFLPLDPRDSIVARSIFEKKPFIIPDATREPRVNPILKERFNLHSLVVIPLVVKEKAMGAIAADHAEPGRHVTQEALESMMTFAQQAGLAILNASMYQELRAFSQQMEEKIQKTSADLRKTEAQLIRSEKLAALGQLAAGIAHEIRNPLTSINILIHSLTTTLPPETAHREDLQVIEEEIQRINEIVEQFLRFARPALPQFQETEIGTVFDETLHLLKPQLDGHRIAVNKEFKALPLVTVDREQMKQVALNLLINAVQSMPEGGRLDLSAKALDDNRGMRLSIRDSGIGIPPENLKRLFDPFFSTKEGGMGLGLSIAHRIIDQHQGKIEVESSPGEGTTFHIWLPLYQEEKDADHTHR